MIRRKAEWWLIPGIKSVNGWNYSSVRGLLPQSAALNFVTNKGASGRPDSIYSVGSMQEWAELLFRLFQVFFYGIKIVNGGIFGFAFGVFARPAE